MTTYIAHSTWHNQQLRQADNWLAPMIAYECTPDELERSDMHYRGYGRHYGAPYPQDAATPEQAARMEQGWQRLLDKAQRDIERIHEEIRLAEYVASHQPDGKELAAIIQMMRRRTNEQSIDEDDGGRVHDGHSGQG